ncbi:MAG: hypothetical protein ACPKM0_09160 [Pleomorphochaeta sp.]
MLKKQYLKSLLIFSFVFSFLFVSCDFTTQSQNGNLTIHFNNENTKSSLVPSIEMEVASYSITGIGPEDRSFTEVTSNGEDVIIDNLYKGTWEITVQGLNSSGTPIGEGTKSVEIIANTTTSTSIVVEEFSGEGELNLDVKWPSQDIEDPNIVSYVISENDDTNTDLEFTINSETASASYSGNLDAGYYTLYLNLYDGETTDINNKLIGKVYSLRIVKDQNTSYTLTTTTDDLNVNGSLSVSVSNNIETTFDVTLSSNQITLYEGSSETLTATPGDEGEYTYSWYLDGKEEDETSNEYTISETLSIGRHNIDVICSKDGMITSSSCVIDIVFPDNYVKVTIYTKDTTNVEKELYLFYGATNFEQGILEEDDSLLEITSDLNIQLVNYDSEDYFNNIFIGTAYNQNIDLQNYSKGNYPNNYTYLALKFENQKGTELPLSDNTRFELISYSSLNSYDNFAFNCSDCDSKYISIYNIGNVGELVNGNVTMKNTSIYSSDDTLIGNYDVEIYFNVTRGNDITISDIILYNNLDIYDSAESYPMLLDEVFTFDEDKLYTDTNYTQINWNTKADGTGTTYETGSTYTVTDSDTSFYAIWEEK